MNTVGRVCFLLAFVLVAGCASNKPQAESSTFSELSTKPVPAQLTLADDTPHLDPALLRPKDELFALGPGDRLEIEIVGNPTTRTVTAVGPDGKIYFNILPGLDVWGLTLGQTQDQLEKQLSQYLRAPHVSVTLRDVASKHIWMIGRMTRPGVYPLTGPTTILEAIATAGGTSVSESQANSSELADLRHSFVMRKGQLLPVDFFRLLHEGDAAQNVVLQPDDFVYIPSAQSQEVYVLGAVLNPRAVSYTEDMTVISAIANAGGPVVLQLLGPTASTGTPIDARLSHIAILRGSLVQARLAVVNYNDIIKGRTPDVRLEPGDIVFIPNSPMGTVKSYINMIANVFVTTISANEGIRAGGGVGNVNIVVPLSTPAPAAAR